MIVTLVEAVALMVYGAFFAIGFFVLHRAGPTRRLYFKPFNCTTCMLGWGSLGFHSLYLYVLQGHLLSDLRVDVTVLCLFLASLGLARTLVKVRGLEPPTADPPFAS